MKTDSKASEENTAMSQLEQGLAAFADFMWGPQLIVLLVGGGLYFYLSFQIKAFQVSRSQC